MPRNVEVKARVHDLEAVKQRVLDLKTASVADDDDCNNDVGDDNVVVSVVMKQEDDFYNLPADRPGKLKLRKVKARPVFNVYNITFSSQALIINALCIFCNLKLFFIRIIPFIYNKCNVKNLSSDRYRKLLKNT